MSHTASYQPLVGVLRVHPFGGAGSPWTWACACAINEDTATIYGAVTAPTPSQWRAITECLRGMGLTKISYERRNTPHDRTVTVSLTEEASK